MTISVVQAVSGADLASSATLAAVAQGNYLVYIAGAYNTGAQASLPTNPTLGGSSLAGPVSIMSQQSPSSGNSIAYQAWAYGPITAGQAGATSAGFTPGNSGAVKLFVIEVSAAAMPVVDASTTNPNRGTSSSYSFGTTGTTAYNSELLVATAQVFNTSRNSGGPSTGTWTQIGGNNYGVAWYQVQTVSGSTYSGSGTWTASGDWAAGIVTLYEAQAAAAAPQPLVVPALAAIQTASW